MLAHSLTAHDQLGAALCSDPEIQRVSEFRSQGRRKARQTYPPWSENHCHRHHHYLSHLLQCLRCHIPTVQKKLMDVKIILFRYD